MTFSLGRHTVAEAPRQGQGGNAKPPSGRVLGDDEASMIWLGTSNSTEWRDSGLHDSQCVASIYSWGQGDPNFLAKLYT